MDPHMFDALPKILGWGVFIIAIIAFSLGAWVF